MCVQTVERHGALIRSVDIGSFNDMTVDMATMSVSRDRLTTVLMSAFVEWTLVRAKQPPQA